MTLTTFLKQTGSSVVYRPALVAIAGSINATILLDQLLYWANGLGKSGQWFYMTQKLITERTGLTRYEQEGARRNLKSRGYLQEKYSGVPRKLYFLLDEDAINKSWEIHQESLQYQHNAEKPQTRMRKTSTQKCEKTTDLDDANPHTNKQYPDTSLNTTTPNSCVSDITSLLSGTAFVRVPEAAIFQAVQQYGFDHVFTTADILAFQARNGKSIQKPASYFAHCLRTGVFPPDGFIPGKERQSQMVKLKKPQQEDANKSKPALETSEDVKRLLSALPFFREQIPDIDAPKDLGERKRQLKEQASQLNSENGPLA